MKNNVVRITLKAARINKNLSQKEAAKALGVSNKTLCAWENGTSAPTVGKAEEISKLYDMPYDNLIFLPDSSLKAN